jgi:hypothetical protein
MSKPNYSNASTMWRRIQTYPNEMIYKMFMGRGFAMDYGQSEHLEMILREFFKKMTDSEREFFLKAYDEYFLIHTIRNWATISKPSIETIQFIYSKIKYQRIMKPGIGFHERLYKWPMMRQIFNEVFGAGDVETLKILASPLPDELQKNIMAFAVEVKLLKETKVK